MRATTIETDGIYKLSERSFVIERDGTESAYNAIRQVNKTDVPLVSPYHESSDKSMNGQGSNNSGMYAAFSKSKDQRPSSLFLS